MQQELKTFLTGDADAKISAQIESDSGNEEIVDCFDSETVLRSDEIKTSEGGVEINQETTLSASFALTETDAAHEQARARQSLEPEDEFYNALVQRVL